MKKLFVQLTIAGLLVSFFYSCEEKAKNTGYSIDWIVNMNIDTAYLYGLRSDGWKALDSVPKTDSLFHFEGSFNGAEYLAIGNKTRSYAVRLLAENNQIKIISDIENPGADSISGSPLHDKFVALSDSLRIFDDQLQSIIAQYEQASMNGDTAILPELEAQYEMYSGLKDKWMLDWVKANNESPVAELLIVNPLMYTITFEELKSLYDSIPPQAQNNSLYTIIKKRVEVLEKSSEGMPAPEINLADTNGNMIALSSMFGNYVLIDFWASWCGPCRVDNPQMVEIYNKYHDMGYQVYGVSLDQKRDRWIQAIKDDNLTWTHVSDLKGWKSEGAATYGVNSIPHTVLIDPDGIIVARGLRGNELEAILSDIFSKAVP